MAEEYQTVDVWVGKFYSREALDSYLEETISGEPEDDDVPISPFAADQSETFYDSDFLEANFREEADTVGSLLDEMSFAKSYGEAVKAAYENSKIDGANVVILSWAQQFKSPRSVTGSDYQLNYVGEFACNPD